LPVPDLKEIRILRQIAKSVVIFPIYHFASFFQIMLDHTKLYIASIIIY